MYITVSVLRAIAENSISLEKLTKEVDQLKILLLRVLENSTSTATNIIDLPDDMVLPMSTLNDVEVGGQDHSPGAGKLSISKFKKVT